MSEGGNGSGPLQGGLTDEQKRDNVVRLVFDGRPERFEEFCGLLRDAIPDTTAVVLRGSAVTGMRRLFGLHLSAVHSAWTEGRRMFELRALLRSIQRHQEGPHLLAGDFNTLALGEILDVQKLPPACARSCG